MNIEETMNVNAIFKYNNNKYLLFVTKNCSRFYLKLCDNNTVDYVTLEEYDELNKKLFPIKPLGHYNIINSKLLLKFKNELVPLSLAATLLASLSGCASDTELTTKGLSKIGIETTMENEEYGLYKITEKDLGENTIYNNFDFSSIGDYPYSVLCTPGEFDKYVGKSNVTFNDLRETVKSNKNIPDDVAGIIIEGIDNLEAADFKINYSTLEYNLQKLNVKCVGVEDMLNANASGEFDQYNCTLLINSQTKDTPAYKHTIIHEILGHGSTIAYDSEKKVLCDVLSSYIKIDEKGNIADIYLYYGKFASEGIADTISSIAENKKFDYNISGYSTQIYDLTTLCSSVGISIEDFANYGIDYLTNKMIEKGIENPYQLILSLDNTVILYQNNVCLQSDSTPMLISYYNELKENGADIEDLKESTTEYKKYLKTVSVDNSNAILSMADDDTLDVVFSEKITEYVNSFSKTKER